MVWTATVLTLFSEMFPGPLGHSLAGKALASDIWRLTAVDIRRYAIDRHQTVDDAPFGGGAGMVMRPYIVARAIDSVVSDGAAGPLLYLSPRGRRIDQALARELAEGSGVVCLCGRFEGVDQRVIEGRGLLEVSLGDFVLSGGEIAAMALIDACVRLLPGVIGDAASLAEESFSDGLLEYPHYTRPADWEGQQVPDVLLSGHHSRIREWRHAMAVETTRRRRPDLLDPAPRAETLRQATVPRACDVERGVP